MVHGAPLFADFLHNLNVMSAAGESAVTPLREAGTDEARLAILLILIIFSPCSLFVFREGVEKSEQYAE
jgi:hypothetical protein